MDSSARDRLINTAIRLFERDGYHATGIDRIIDEAGVAKMTLYNHFRSKDDLILAVLRRRDENFRNRLVRTVEKAGADPRGRLLAIFDVLEEWFKAKDFRGCMFISAVSEFPDQSSAIQHACREHKRLIDRFLRDLAQQAGAPDAALLARRLSLLIEGAIVTAQMQGDAAPARDAKSAAEALIDSALQ